MRLIDADAYLGKVCTYNETGCGSCKLQTKCPVDETTVDAVPVKHGQWLLNKYNGISIWHCSECRMTGNERYDYCPNCGARMDEDEAD